MSGRYIDLHTHSIVSDGSDTPAELVRKAARHGLAALALTDHDSLAGLEEAEEAARAAGIEFVRGVEIAVEGGAEELHLLGLWMPRRSARLREALACLRRQREGRNRAILDKLGACGVAVSMEEVRAVSRGETVGRPHIALALINKGYASGRKEAFERYLGRHGKAFVPRVLPAPKEGMALLRDAGATVALAHPFLSPLMTRERLDDLAADLRAWGLSALEAYHNAHDARHTRLCVEVAARHNLLICGGSDYHGANKNGVALGVGKGDLRIPYALLSALRERRKNEGLPV
jgi:predicted metal-dependent phosphoesterase TrpH